MPDQKPRIFLGSTKKIVFKNGGQIFKIGIPEDHIALLKKNIRKGWVNIVLAKKKNATGEENKDYYCYIDDYVSEKNAEQVQNNNQPQEEQTVDLF